MNETLSPDATRARVLVVDDETAMRDMLDFGLTRAGLLVKGAADGTHALEIVRAWSPDLIVLDIMLPGTDGFELLPALRRLTEIPILVLSAKTETDEKITGLSRGADDYIAKPFELSELIARIHTALRRPRMGRREILRYRDLSVDLERRATFRGPRRSRSQRASSTCSSRCCSNRNASSPVRSCSISCGGFSATSSRTRSKRTSPISAPRSTAASRRS
jgi:DNA-binding response OmpR family regulator